VTGATPAHTCQVHEETGRVECASKSPNDDNVVPYADGVMIRCRRCAEEFHVAMGAMPVHACPSHAPSYFGERWPGEFGEVFKFESHGTIQ
jgi:hypothetical protein